ncbi:MAG: DoxX family protein [Chitinophagaceae bacterium]
MKKTNTIYWIFTGILVALMLFSGIQNLLSTEPSIKLISKQLGYPEYFLPFIGLAKTLGAIAILIPGYPRIKEWVYAGFTYDLMGALYSTIAVGEPFANWWPMLFFFVILAFSYIYYHKRLKAVSPANIK